VSNPTVAKNTVEIVVNGEPRLVTDGATVETFLSAHEIDPDTVVVEANGVILPRDRFGATGLSAGDTLEVVHFVGGG
jgi:thiamine biosynthesis protein ThiS